MKNKKKELNTDWVLAEQRLPWEEEKVLLMKKHWGCPRVGKYSKDTFLVDGVVINNTLEDPVFWLKIDSYEFIQKDEWNYVKYDKCDVCKKQIEELEDIERQHVKKEEYQEALNIQKKIQKLKTKRNNL